MNTKTTLSITEARKRIFEITEEVQASHKTYTLTADGKPKAVIMSAEEYESWQETMEVIADFPDLDKDIKETEKAWKSGEWKNWKTLEQLETKYGLAVAEKPAKKYGIHTKAKTKGRKGAR